MDMFTIVATIWRHKFATLPVILITLIGCAYVLVVKPPTYTANANILLIDPPSPPTTAQIAADPALGKVNTSNPYLSYGNLVLVADIVIDLANSPAAGQKLQAEGVTTKYTVALENAFQNPPVIQVSGTGGNSAVAINASNLVAQEVMTALREIQVQQNVNPTYMITGEEFVKPTVATTTSSSKLRTVIGFGALGLIMILIAVSIAQSLEKRRGSRKPKPSASKNGKGSGDREPSDPQGHGPDEYGYGEAEWQRPNAADDRPERDRRDNRTADDRSERDRRDNRTPDDGRRGPETSMQTQDRWGRPGPGTAVGGRGQYRG